VTAEFFTGLDDRETPRAGLPADNEARDGTDQTNRPPRNIPRAARRGFTPEQANFR